MARLDTPRRPLARSARPAEAALVRLLHRAGPGAGETFRQLLAARRRRTGAGRASMVGPPPRRVPDPHARPAPQRADQLGALQQRVSSPRPRPCARRQSWHMYSHISTGWYGKEWGGDHAGDGGLPAALRARCRRRTASSAGSRRRWSPSTPKTTRRTGSIRSGGTTPGPATGSSSRDLWPAVRKAVAWQRSTTIPTATACSATGTSTGTATPTAKARRRPRPARWSWAMLDRAARMAGVVGDAEGRDGIPRRWPKRRGRRSSASCGAKRKGGWARIGADGIWRGHPQTWEEYLAINAGLLSPEQGRRAMRWLGVALRLRAAAGRAAARVQRLVADPLERASGCPPATPAWPRWPA